MYNVLRVIANSKININFIEFLQSNLNSLKKIKMEKKPMGFSLSFSKTKTKTTLVQTNATKLLDESDNKSKKNGDPNGEIEIITSLEGKKINTLIKKEEKNKPLVIPCQKNQPVFDISKALEKKAKDGNASKEDLEAIQALIKDSKDSVNGKKDSNLTIPMNKNEEENKKEEEVEEPNYENVDLEQFGMAALRGMGWNEKTGIGLTNKRSADLFIPEVRPKGLGLGAGLSNKKHRSNEDDERSSNQENSLKYVKGAYVQILSGKHQDEYGQLISFDDGLNRILIKLHDSQETISILQSLTRLVSKSDFARATERHSRR